LPLTWVEQRLAQSGLTITRHLVQAENQQQAADQMSISNSIGSLRVLGAMDWQDFVESLSLVEQTLRERPGRHLRTDGFCDPRPLSPCHRGDCPEGFLE
jgi:cyclic beta-1,2-glucan synthetase